MRSLKMLTFFILQRRPFWRRKEVDNLSIAWSCSECSSRSAVQSRVERQRRRLRASSTSSLSSCSHSPEPPSPAASVPGEPACSKQVPPVFVPGDPISSQAPPTASASYSTNQSSSEPFVRVLIHRASLTTHTAFSRTDNVQPAPVTAVLPARFNHPPVIMNEL